MTIIVQKFGGTSVANATKIQAAAQRAVAAHRAGHQVVLVVSARGKKTDELVRLAREISDDPRPREMDMLLSTGEQESVALMAMAIQELGEQATSLTGGQIGVYTDSAHTKARIISISTERIRSHLDQGQIVIAAGFQGIDDDGNITTLGRGGSDTTATALAAVLDASECEVYTDVEGVFTTDPRIVESARKIERVAYDEMLELASLGAGVMHSRSIEFAQKYRVTLRVRPARSDGQGTLICQEAPEVAPVVTGVAFVQNEARVSLREIPDRPGAMSLIFSKMADRKISIDMVVQNVGTGGAADVSFTVPQDDLAETLTAAQEAVNELGAGSIATGTNVAKVSIVGCGMRTHTGVAAQMFQDLGEAGINVEMVTTSEIKVSVLVNRDMSQIAVAAVHAGFQLDQPHAVEPEFGSGTGSKNGQARGSSLDLESQIVSQLSSMEDIVVSEVQLDLDQARITVDRLPDTPGVLAAVFKAVAEGGIMVDMIVQNVAHNGEAHLSFTVPVGDLEVCVGLVQSALSNWPETSISSDSAIAKLSVMGIGLRSHTGVGEKMFRALAEEDINVQMINTSEIRISAAVDAAIGHAAQRCLFRAFGLSSPTGES